MDCSGTSLLWIPLGQLCLHFRGGFIHYTSIKKDTKYRDGSAKKYTNTCNDTSLLCQVYGIQSLSLPLSSPSLSLPPSLPPFLSHVSLQKEQLHIAIMDYLNHHSKEKEKLERLQLVALKFKMFRELAKLKEQQAIKELKKIKTKSLGEALVIFITLNNCFFMPLLI